MTIYEVRIRHQKHSGERASCLVAAQNAGKAERKAIKNLLATRQWEAVRGWYAAEVECVGKLNQVHHG